MYYNKINEPVNITELMYIITFKNHVLLIGPFGRVQL